MVKKLKSISAKKTTAGTGLLDSQLANSVKDSAHQIWLAGMGAFSKAQAEGGKVFEALIKEGTSLQKKTQHVAEEKFNEVSSKMTGMAGEVQSRAGQQWDKLESIFEARTAKALGKLGVPSAKDVESLTRRIDELNEQIAQMGKTAATRKSAARPAAKSASKPTAKPAEKRAARPAVKRSTAAKTG